MHLLIYNLKKSFEMSQLEQLRMGKNIFERTAEKRLRWFGHVKVMPGNRLPPRIVEWEPEGTRRKERLEVRWMDGWTDGWGKQEYDEPQINRRGY
jgi:hypothetical protein